MYAYVYLRRLYPKEIENFEIFKPFLAKNRKSLHSKGKKLKKNAFPVPKIKKICIPSTENEKKSILPMQKMQNICIANARIKKFALPMQSKLKRLHCHCKK